MPEAFLSLGRWLTPPPQPLLEKPVPSEPPVAENEPRDLEALSEVLRDVRYFRAVLADALDARLADVLRDMAADVLARELELKDADLAAIVRRASERYACPPLAVRVHPSDAQTLAAHLPVVADTSLRRGDVVLEVQAGSIDARLGVRLDSVLKAYA